MPDLTGDGTVRGFVVLVYNITDRREAGDRPDVIPPMPRTVDDILRDIEAFRPTDGVWLPLDDLLAELWDAGVPARALPTLFGVFERFPGDDGAGVLWSIVHGVEGLDLDYEQPLRDSLARQASDMGKIMLGRLERSKTAG